MFHPGQTSGLIEVPIADDAFDEPVETFKVRLSDARFAPIADAVGVVTITDDDDPPALTVNDKSRSRATRGRPSTSSGSHSTRLPRSRSCLLRDRRPHRDGPLGLRREGRHPDLRARSSRAPSRWRSLATWQEATETFRLLVTGAQNAAVLDGSGRGEIVDDD